MCIEGLERVLRASRPSHHNAVEVSAVRHFFNNRRRSFFSARKFTEPLHLFARMQIAVPDRYEALDWPIALAIG